MLRSIGSACFFCLKQDGQDYQDGQDKSSSPYGCQSLQVRKDLHVSFV